MTNLKIEKGQIFTEFQSYKVLEAQGNKVTVENENGDKIGLPTQYVEQLLFSADYFETEEKLTMTELAEKFTSSSRIAMSVAFYKANKKKTQKAVKAEKEAWAKEVVELFNEKGKSAVEEYASKPVLDYIPGELRVMKGYHYGTMNELGRINFIDRECTDAHNIRQVDPRTIQYLIVNKVKYSLKK